MASPHDAHVKAVGLAGMKVEEVQAALPGIMTLAQEAMQAILLATGGTPSNAYGARAIETMSGIQWALDEQIAACQQVIADLNAYTGSF